MMLWLLEQAGLASELPLVLSKKVSRQLLSQNSFQLDLTLLLLREELMLL